VSDQRTVQQNTHSREAERKPISPVVSFFVSLLERQRTRSTGTRSRRWGALGGDAEWKQAVEEGEPTWVAAPTHRKRSLVCAKAQITSQQFGHQKSLQTAATIFSLPFFFLAFSLSL
jgi:hypothetical protein